MSENRQKAVAYLRVSGRGQIGGDGFPRQREAVQKYAKAHDIELVDEYRDEGVCGEKDLGSRPGLGPCWTASEATGSGWYWLSGPIG